MAFGPPGSYAARIAEETGATPGPGPSSVRRLLISALTTAGTLLAVEGAVGLTRQHAAPVTAAALVAALLMPVLLQVATRVIRNPAVAGCATGLGYLVVTQFVQVVVLVWFRQPVLVSLPAWAATVIGVVVVLASVVVAGPERRRGGLAPVTDPRPGTAHGDRTVWGTAQGAGGVPRTIAWVAAALCVAETTALTLVVLLLR